MMRKTLIIGVMGLLALLFGGCSAAPADARTTLEQHAAAIDEATHELFGVLAEAGFTDAGARSVVETCRSEPAPGLSYEVRITATGDDPAEQYTRLSEGLTSSGWVQEKDSLGGDQPSGRFSRDGLTLDVKTGGFKIGDEVHGADELTLALSRDDGCVDVADGGAISEVRDLEKEILPPG